MTHDGQEKGVTRKKKMRGIRGHLPLGVGIDLTWVDVLACHVSECGISIVSFFDPW
jgi:hypothetical protein